MTTDDATKIGMQIVILLGLKSNKDERYPTGLGDKSYAGLARAINRIIIDHTSPEPEKNPVGRPKKIIEN